MLSDERMSIHERRKYLKPVAPRYVVAKRRRRSELLTQMSEFFSDHLVRYFGEKTTGLRLSRSRPYRKNDNRFVEQKNSTLVRAYVGYEPIQQSERRQR